MITSEICEWVDDKAVFWKIIIKEYLEKGPLSDDFLDEITNILASEKSEEELKRRLNAETIDFNGYLEEEKIIALQEISKVLGVGVIDSEQQLSFNENGLNIIYGENGTGKSSYASVMKKVFLSRGGSKEILGNVFEEVRTSPSACIKYWEDGVSKDFTWNSNTQNLILKNIRVFDTQAAIHYLQKEGATSYMPEGIKVLDELIRSLKYIKEHLEEKKSACKYKDFSSVFITKTISDLVAGINEQTKIEEIKKHTITEDELGSIQSLEHKLEKLKTNSPERLSKIYTIQITNLNILKNKIIDWKKPLGNQAFLRLKELTKNKLDTIALADKLRATTFTDLDCDSFDSHEWVRFWRLIKDFIVTNGGDTFHFPAIKGEKCPYCLQSISSESAEKLLKFNDYLLSDAERKANDASSRFNYAISVIKNCEIRIDEITEILNVLEMENPSLSRDLRKFCLELTSRRSAILEGKDLSEETNIDESSIERLSDYISELNKTLSKIRDQKKLDSEILETQEKFDLLHDKNILSNHLDEIIEEIKLHQCETRIASAIKLCSTKSASDLSAKISKEKVISPLIEIFNEELKKLGFDRFLVEINDRNRLGEELFKLKLKDASENKINEVASEGEQRCIALAAFFADIQIGNRKSSIIFDDPMNSLSHRWRSIVARRIVKESQLRQVIVLTHDIVFFKLLLEEAEQFDIIPRCLELQRTQCKAGLVKDSMPWDALTTKKRIAELHKKQEELELIYNTKTESEFKTSAYSFYSYLRETWERFVEEEVLNKVVTRFERGIQTQRLKRLIDLTEEDIQRVEKGMTRCSVYFRGHDSANQIGDPFIRIEDIKNDLQELEKFHKEMAKRRN